MEPSTPHISIEEQIEWQKLRLESSTDISHHLKDPAIFATLQRVKEMEKRLKIVCYCGSLRVAGKLFQDAEYQSIFRGEIALLPCCMFVDIQREYGELSDYKIKADELHKRKIDICDEVFVLNVGGYIGESTRSEIEYAKKINKPITYLEKLQTPQA